MKYLSVLLAIIISSLTLSAQNTTDSDVRPFAYMTYDEYGSTLHVIDLNHFEILHTIESSTQSCPLRISPDNRYLIYTDYDDRGNIFTYNRLDLQTGEDKQIQSDVLYSPDGRLRALLHDGNEVTLIDNESGAYAAMVTISNGEHYFWVDNQLFAVLIRRGQFQLYRTRGREAYAILVLDIPDDRRIADYSVSPAGNALIYTFQATNGGERTSWLMDVTTDEQVALFEDDPYQLAAWHPDGTQLALVVDDRKVIIYDLATGDITELAEYRRVNRLSVGVLRWSPDGRYLLHSEFIPGGTYDNRYALHLYDTVTGTNSMIQDFIRLHPHQVEWVSDSELVYTFSDARVSPYGDDHQVDLIIYDTSTLSRLHETATDEFEALDCGIG